MQLRCTEEKICPKRFVRKCLCLEQKYLNQVGGPRVFYKHEFCGVPYQISSKLVVVFLVPGPGASTHILLLISRNCLQNLACISIPASGDRFVYYRSPIDCKIVIPIYEMGSCKLRYLWCQMACLHSCCVHEFSRFTDLAYQTRNSLPSKTCHYHKQLQSSQWSYSYDYIN